MLIAVLAAFAAGLAAPVLTRPLADRAGWVLALLPGGLTAYFLALSPAVRDGGALVQSVTWVPQLGVDAAFRLDGLSLLFALMITGIGTVITVYAGGYLRGDRQLPRFFLLLFAFMGAMLGVVLADDLITLFVFWELTSFTSYFLIGYGHEDAGSRANALQAMLVTAAGGLAMLAGFLMMGAAAGTFRISEILADPALLHASGWYLPMLALVAAGAFTKSAQFPFHFWLPNAMAAPTPVSAYLHSATMVKAGVYLLARTAPALGGTAAWTWLLVLAGAATVVAAAVLALLQRDAKRLLAYSTLIALGTLVLLIGIDTRYAATAMVVYMLAHALYKAPLFMVAGSLDHEAGTRDVTELSGVGRLMPVTWTIALAAGLSAAGILPMLGFVGKELVYESLLSQPLPLAVLVAANAAMVVITVLVAWRPFAGGTPRAPKAPHEAPLSMTAGPMTLAGLGLVFGVAPALVQDGLLAPAAGAVHGAATGVSIYLWHGLTPALGLSAVTLLLGAVLTWRWRAVHLMLRRRYGERSFGPAQAYEHTMGGWCAWRSGRRGCCSRTTCGTTSRSSSPSRSA
ncbi:MAG: proton-conducting transporter membrane subunit [Trueperaceae bacterium]|nr:proton-conducting transporter membrane subunit [Trueperaceae bacterium]